MFLQLCCDDQRRILNVNPLIDVDATRGDQTIEENGSISPLNVNQGETSFSQMKKKELVKNRSYLLSFVEGATRMSLFRSALFVARRAALDCCVCPHLHKIYALMVKDLTVIKRNIG